MAEDTAQKTLLEELKKGRAATIKELGEVIKKQGELLAAAKSGSKDAKTAAANQLKAAKARDALLKQDVSLAGDLKKNFKDITLLYGFQNYPTNINDLNLHNIVSLKNSFGKYCKDNIHRIHLQDHVHLWQALI